MLILKNDQVFFFYASIPKDIELIEKRYVIRKKHNLPVRLLEKRGDKKKTV